MDKKGRAPIIADPSPIKRLIDMNKITVGILLIMMTSLTVTAAKAMPLAPIGMEQTAPAIPIAEGCGFNRYRDARGICRKKYVINRHQGRRPLYTGCGGVDSHRVCNLYGRCWTVCD